MIKKLYVSFISMGLLTFTLATSTFAWATISTTNRVDGIGLTARQDSNLEFSLDGINYSSEINEAQIMAYIKDAVLMDWTTIDGVNFTGTTVPFIAGEMNFEAVPNKNYIQLILYVRSSQARYTDLYLINNVSNTVNYNNVTARGTYVTSRGVNYRSPVTFLYDINDTVMQGEVRTYYAKDAIRVSFTELLIEDDTRDEASLNQFIWDPSGNPNRGFAKAFGATDFTKKYHNLYFQLPTHTQPVIPGLTTFTDPNAYLPDNTLSRVASLQRSDEVNEQNRNYFKGKFMINIWIEGWDADAFDAVFTDKLKIQFEFQSALPIDI